MLRHYHFPYALQPAQPSWTAIHIIIFLYCFQLFAVFAPHRAAVMLSVLLCTIHQCGQDYLTISCMLYLDDQKISILIDDENKCDCSCMPKKSTLNIWLCLFHIYACGPAAVFLFFLLLMFCSRRPDKSIVCHIPPETLGLQRQPYLCSNTSNSSPCIHEINHLAKIMQIFFYLNTDFYVV